jgi:hypothetical protein
MTHTEIFTKLQGNWNRATKPAEALIHGYGKRKTDWHRIVTVIGFQSEYTLKVNLDGRDMFIPNRCVKEVRYRD